MPNYNHAQLNTHMAGANKLIYDSGYLSAAVTNAAITNLDSDLDGGYDFELIVVNATGSPITISSYFNSDTTDAHYWRVGWYAGAATGNITANNAALDGFDSGNTRVYTGRIIFTLAGTVRVPHVIYQGYGTDHFVLNYAVANFTGIGAKITRWDLVSNVANGFGVGSRLRIWRRSNSST